MRMTIEEAITWLNTDDYESKGFADAASIAIDTMRKYQKLEAYMRKLEKSAQYGTLRKLKIALGEIEDE